MRQREKERSHNISRVEVMGVIAAWMVQMTNESETYWGRHLT